MLILSRKPGEVLHIGSEITVTFIGIDRHGNARLGITADRSTPIFRAELLDRARQDQQAAKEPT